MESLWEFHGFMTHLISQLVDFLRVKSIDVDRLRLLLQCFRVSACTGLYGCIDFDLIVAGLCIIVSTDQKKTYERMHDRQKMMWLFRYLKLQNFLENEVGEFATNLWRSAKQRLTLLNTS